MNGSCAHAGDVQGRQNQALVLPCSGKLLASSAVVLVPLLAPAVLSACWWLHTHWCCHISSFTGRSPCPLKVPSSRSVLRGLCYQEFCEVSATLVTWAALHGAAAVPRTLSCPPSCLLGAVPGTAPAFPKNVLRRCLGKCCLAQARSCGWLTNRLG